MTRALLDRPFNEADIRSVLAARGFPVDDEAKLKLQLRPRWLLLGYRREALEPDLVLTRGPYAGILSVPEAEIAAAGLMFGIQGSDNAAEIRSAAAALDRVFKSQASMTWQGLEPITFGLAQVSLGIQLSEHSGGPIDKTVNKQLHSIFLGRLFQAS